MTQWDALQSETQHRAFGVEEYRIRRMIRKGKLAPTDYIRKTGTTTWIQVKDLDDSVWTDPEVAPKEKKKSKSKPPAPELPPTVPEIELKPPVAEFVDDDEGELHPAVVDARQPTQFAPDPKAWGEDVSLAPVASPSESHTWKSVKPPPMHRGKKDLDDDVAFTLRRKRHDEELDLTSMVDVIFLLILFFMITATYSMQKVLDVPTPDATDQSAQQASSMDDLQDDNVIIEVTSDNKILLNDRPVPARELTDLIRKEFREMGVNEIILKASGEATHQTVVTAFDAANEAGPQRIRLASSDEVEPPG